MRRRRAGHHTLALPRQVRSARCWAVCERRTHTHSHSRARPCKTCVTRAPGPKLSWLTAHRHAPPPATQEPPLPSLAAKCCPPLGVSGAAGRVGAPHRPDGGAVCFGSSQEHAGNEEAPPCYLLRTLTSLPLLPAPFPFVCPVLYLLPPLAPLPPSPRPP